MRCFVEIGDYTAQFSRDFSDSNHGNPVARLQ